MSVRAPNGSAHGCLMRKRAYYCSTFVLCQYWRRFRREENTCRGKSSSGFSAIDRSFMETTHHGRSDFYCTYFYTFVLPVAGHSRLLWASAKLTACNKTERVTKFPFACTDAKDRSAGVVEPEQLWFCFPPPLQSPLATAVV